MTRSAAPANDSAVADDEAATFAWARAGERHHCIGLWSENRLGKGEDAEPLVVYDAASGRGVIACLDGMGGAGSAPARRVDGRDLTHARVASALGRSIIFDRIVPRLLEHGLPDRGDIPLATTLHDELRTAFAEEAAGLEPVDSRLGGSLIAALPTTLAMVAFESLRDRAVRALSLWAGDARSYVLCPVRGLSQLTHDDSVAADAFEALVKDPPTTNRISASGEFSINARHIWLLQPTVLISATDGCFGYLRTPADLELIVLESLNSAASLQEFADGLSARLRGLALDDASMALIAVGFPDLRAIKAAYEPRLAELRELLTPLDGAGATHPDGLSPEVWREVRREVWQRYQRGYEYYVRKPTPASREVRRRQPAAAASTRRALESAEEVAPPTALSPPGADVVSSQPVDSPEAEALSPVVAAPATAPSSPSLLSPVAEKLPPALGFPRVDAPERPGIEEQR